MNKAQSDLNFAMHGFLCSCYGSFILFYLCKLINSLMVHLKFSLLCVSFFVYNRLWLIISWTCVAGDIVLTFDLTPFSVMCVSCFYKIDKKLLPQHLYPEYVKDLVKSIQKRLPTQQKK